MFSVNTFKLRFIDLLKRCWLVLAIFIIVLALLFSFFRALTPWAKQYKGEIERHLSALIGQPVTIKGMETSWYWFEPVLKLNEIEINGAHQPIVHLHKLLVGINLLSSLWHWQIKPGILYIDDIHVSVRQTPQGGWQIDGIQPGSQSLDFKGEANWPLLQWFLTQQKIRLQHISAQIYLKDGALIPLHELNLTITNHGGHYRLKGSASLEQTIATKFSILGDMSIAPNHPAQATGQLYLDFKDILPAQWQALLPISDYQVFGGRGDVELWIDFADAHMKSIQTRLQATHVALGEEHNSEHLFLQSLKGNFDWHKTDNGWRLSGDNMIMRLAGVTWPQNSFVVDYHSAQQWYSVYIRTLLVDTAWLKYLPFPKSMEKAITSEPTGILEDTKFVIEADKLRYILTRFKQFSWNSDNQVPGMRHLSGVLQWQAGEGRVALDSHDVTFIPEKQAPVNFDQLNGDILWKELSHGTKIRIDRFIMTRPDVVLTGHGVIDKGNTAENTHLNLLFKYSAQHAEQWLPYIPAKYLKPRLNDWVKNDIQQIQQMSGKLNINGTWANFPYDNNPGTFEISSYIHGSCLYFNRKWPEARDVSAFVNLNKRQLNIDLTHADLQGIMADQVNIRINDLGLGKERLFMHGKCQAPAKQALDYVMHSPLREKLAKLNMIDIEGKIGLELRMDIPLYFTNMQPLARGHIHFMQNDVHIHHSLSDLMLQKFSGNLAFSEKGITSSSFKAELWDSPVTLSIKTIRTPPKPYTEVQMQGDVNIKSLNRQFKQPLLSFLDGHLPFATVLTLTDSPDDLDKLFITSPLTDVTIDLPPPFTKQRGQEAVSALTLYFNPHKALNIQFNYNNLLSSALWFDAEPSGLKLTKGEIRFGSGHALVPKSKVVRVIGSLSTFDSKAWQGVWAALPEKNTQGSGITSYIDYIDLKIKSLDLWEQNLPNMIIKAKKQGSNDWSAQVEQSSIKGNLYYYPNKFMISGRLQYLRLPPFKYPSSPGTTSISMLSPERIPNLYLSVDSLVYDHKSLGSVMLKSTSYPNRWHLDYCKINAPDYQSTFSGDWVQEGGKDKTVFKGDVQILHLADALKRFSMPPVVEASSGDIAIKGKWPGNIADFSLDRLDGQLFIMLKHGRITNLSPATEEKLALGKLLSILSLQTIPRRLHLDFSDLAQDGYSFDIFQGNFRLNKGNMSTKDSYIDGPVAYASMHGSLDLKKQLYDLNLRISPHITASLPVVATIAGGPVAGIATWVASNLISQGMHRVSGYTYKISGPWHDPVVQQVSIINDEQA